MSKIKYKYLRAWDTMMHSGELWMSMMQDKAEEEHAPITAVYRRTDGIWVTFEEVENTETRNRIQQMVDNMESYARRCQNA